MLNRALDAIDDAAGGFIRLAYLLAGVVAVAVYFGAGHLPAAATTALDAALPWVLSAAVETHTYLTARRVRAAWQDRQAAARGTDGHAKAADALRVNLAVLAGLLAFSAYNQAQYLAATWTPPHTALALPGPLAYLVRAVVVPAAFMAAALLAPAGEPLTAQVEAEARATLADVFRIARRQRRKLLRQAERDGRDMTTALVELVPDPDARRIIGHAYAAIRAPIATPVAALADVAGDAFEANETTPRPPTGGGSPVAVVPGASKRRAPAPRRRADVLRLTPPDDAERRIRALLAGDPSMSVRTLARRAKVSMATASKWAAVARSERERPQAEGRAAL